MKKCYNNSRHPWCFRKGLLAIAAPKIIEHNNLEIKLHLIQLKDIILGPRHTTLLEKLMTLCTLVIQRKENQE